MLNRVTNLFGFGTKKDVQQSLEFLPRFYDSWGSTKVESENLFKSNPVVYRCISTIAKSIASIRWYLKDSDGPVKENMLQYILSSPNPLQCKEEFLEALISNLMLYGNAYIYKTGTSLYSWQVLKSSKVRLHSNAKGIPEYYIYTNGNVETKIPIDKQTGQCDLLNMRFFNPGSEYYGLSPCQVIAKVVEFYNQVTDHNISLLKRGGRPSGVLVVDSKGIKHEQFRQLEDNVRKWVTGSSNAGEVLVLTSDCKWEEMGLKPLDTNFLEGQHAAARQIAQVFGVPPMIIGIHGDATFSNYKQARVHFWEDTILPLMSKICGELNAWFFKEFGLELVPDFHSIEALEIKRNEEWKHIDEVSFLTINEKRAHFGYPPLDDNKVPEKSTK